MTQALIKRLQAMKAARLAEVQEIDQLLKSLNKQPRKKRYDFTNQLNNRKTKLLQK